MEIYSNEYRKYLGVKPLKDNYKCEIYENGCIKILVYFDKDSPYSKDDTELALLGFSNNWAKGATE